jgi:hypothetical protein
MNAFYSPSPIYKCVQEVKSMRMTFLKVVLSGWLSMALIPATGLAMKVETVTGFGLDPKAYKTYCWIPGRSGLHSIGPFTALPVARN